MVKKVINVGVEGNDASGDPIREAFIKANENFNELYSAFGQGDGISITALEEGPEETFPNSILIMNDAGDQYLSKTLEGQGGIEIINSDPQKLIISSLTSSVNADDSPSLGNHLDANTFNILRLGDPNPITAAAYGASEDSFAINKGYADSHYVNLTGDTMTGPLNVPAGASGTEVPRANETVLRSGGTTSQMTGPLILQRKIRETDDPLTAATKEYVDVSSFISQVNLFVSNQGDDNQFDVPDSRKGRSEGYAFRTLSAACRYAQRLIEEASYTVSITVKDITYSNGDSVSQILDITPVDDYYVMTILNDGATTDPRDADDIRPGQIIKGKVSGAIARIEEVIDGIITYEISPGVTVSAEEYRVQYVTNPITQPFITTLGGEPLEYGNPARDLQITIFVEAGNYYEHYPIRVPVNVSIVGDELRRTIIRPRPGRSASWAIDTYFRRDPIFDVNLQVTDRLFGYHYLTDTSKSLYHQDIISTTGVVGSISGSFPEWTGTITSMSSTSGLNEGDLFTATQGTGRLGTNGVYTVTSILGLTSIEFKAYSGTTPIAGTISNIKIGRELSNVGNYNNASFILLENREFIQEEVISYVNTALRGLQYNEEKCRRDTGLIITALAYDMAFGSNFASIASARAYYRGTQAAEVLGADKIATLESLDYLQTRLETLALSPTSDSRIASNISLMKSIINTGLSAVPVINWPIPSNRNSYSTSRTILFNNKAFLQAEIVAYIDQQIAANTSNTSSIWYNLEIDGSACARDVGLIIDAVVYDLTYGGNSQTVDAGSAYFFGLIDILRPEEVLPTLSAYEVLKNRIEAIILNEPFVNYQTSINRVGGTAGTEEAAQDAVNLMEIIIYIIDTDGDIPTKINPGISSVETSVAIDFTTIISAISTLQDDVIDYINNNFFIYDEELCKRDVGLLVDALGYDLVYGGFYRSLEAANSYFESASALIAINEQLNETSAAINYLGIIAQRIVQKLAPVTLYQNAYPASIRVLQSTSMEETAEVGSTNVVNDLVGFMLDIITNTSTINPPKDNNAEGVDAFLMNDATIIRTLSCQEHGGFMVVLDPLGQILTKSPYVQTASSFCRSINERIFAGGMFVDAFAGNLQAQITSRVDERTINVDGLTYRLPNLPCAFYINGVRFQVDLITDWDQEAGTATVHINPATPDDVEYTEANEFLDSTRLFLASTSIEFLSAGNNSMLCNDYTQLNDLGYGLVAINGGLLEAVGVFTYYNQISYFADTGGQIRSVGGSSAHGAYGLVAANAYPLEVPDEVFLLEDMIIGASVYSPFDLRTNEPADRISGAGSGATFDIVTNTAAYVVTLNNPGTGYTNGTILNISGGTFGGITGINDITITVTGNSGGLITTFTYTGTIPEGAPVNDYYNRADDTFIYIDNLTNDIRMPNGSELEVVIGTSPNREIIRYVVNNVSEVQDTNDAPEAIVGTLYRLNLASGGLGGSGGIREAILNNDRVTIRMNTGLFLYDIKRETATRPSTALVFDESPLYVNRVIGISNISSEIGEFVWPIGTNIATITATAHGFTTAYPASYTALAGTNISGTGASATFNISVALSGYTVTINAPGTGYANTNVIRILGTSLGGVSPANDINITVTSVNGLGGITGISFTGVVTPLELYIVFLAGEGPIPQRGFYPITVTNINEFFVTTTSTSEVGSIGSITYGSANGEIETTVKEPFRSVQITTYFDANAQPVQPFTVTVDRSFNNTSGSPNQFNCISTSVLTANQEIRFTGTIGGVVANQSYYVKTIVSDTRFTISDTLVVGVAGPVRTLTTQIGTMFGTVNKVGSTFYTWGVTGSYKLAINNLSIPDAERIQWGIDNGFPMILGWRGRIHEITNYISREDNGTQYAVLEIDNLTGDGFYESVGVLEGGWDNVPGLKGMLQADSPGNITVNISTVRVTGHDLLDIGTGSYAQTNFPNTIFGRPDRSPDQGAEVVERGKGRCFFVTSDQDGNFRVGDFFIVDQGTGTVTFSSSIAISNLDGLGFKRGVAVAEFSVDQTMFDNATDTVPTEQAVRGYVEKRLGLSHNGSPVLESELIPPGAGFMCLNGDLAMKADMDMANHKILRVDDPVSPSDATNKDYVDAFLRRQGGASRSDIQAITMRADVTNASGTVGSISGSGPWSATITGLSTTTNVAIGNTIVATNGTGSLGTGGLYTVTSVGATSVDFSAVGGTTPTAGTITSIEIYAGTLDMNGNKITNLATPTTNFDAATKLYVDTLTSAQNELRELGGVSLPNPITGVTNNSLFAFNGTNFTWGGQAGDVLFTLGTGPSANTLTSAIQPGVIINSDVSASAAIDQSKLNMTIASTSASAPSGGAATIQAASGLASFDSANFEISNGWVGIKANGVALSEIAQIGSDTVIGNSSGSSATPSAVSFATVVQEGGGLYLQQFSNNGAVVRIGVNSYTTVAYTASYTGSGDNSTLVQRDSSGGFSASTINATTQFNVAGSVAFRRSADATPYLEIITPQGNTSISTRTVSSVVNTTIAGDLTLSASGRSSTVNGSWSVTGAWTLASGATLESTYAADIAEYYQGDKTYEPGTVVMIGGEFDVTLANGAGTTKVAGVISTEAAYIMNGSCPGEKNLVALQGRVPCKVIGKVEKGDLMVVGIVPGVAMASNDPKPGSIIGKALQNYDSDHVGTIEVMVGKH